MTSDSWRSLRIIPLAVALMSSCTHQGPGTTTHGTAMLGASELQPTRSVELAQKRGLADVRRVIPGIDIDLRYATSTNVTGEPLYPSQMPCLLRTETAKKLKRAQAILRAQGYGLRIWDAYRPPEAQEALHKHGGSTGMFLSPNAGWSRHCGGIAVDLTLVDAHGNEQRMPTGFDQDFANASRNYRGADPVVRQNLVVLQTAMKQAGFTQLESEWWHFDDADYLNHPQPIVYGWQIALPGMSAP
ncbi:M15 family metallopeptidase [Prosthecobacter sp.]|uniref:M15 family metallopeptidase n=1 Tax=Prosthecobacter sp. TaxID=1965333 RepID=UPI0024894C92|nr:M15 family metallopeptidase [Prosthecobacter sp.]MDI1315288.1 M15 family metallopeptidase [Prosthecobacter sp.]